jgi:glycosyltransferase involved in cell wall biosynthesis
MRILLVTHRLWGGGAEQVARTWLRALSESGHDVSVLVLDREDHGRVLDVHVINASNAGVKGFLKRVNFVRRSASQMRTEVIICLQTYPNLLGILATLGRRSPKVLISEHNVPSVYLSRGPASHRIQRALARLLYRKSTFAIGVSHSVATDLIVRFGIPQQRIAVIPNGIVDDYDLDDTRNVAGPIHLVVPARLSWQKRPAYAAEIVEELRSRGHEVHLKWIGDPVESERELGHLANEWFEIQTWRDDWWVDISHNSIVLLPSSIEGLGNVLLDSARHGLWSVAGSPALGTGDAIVPGLTGFLATTDSVEAFADAIEKAATSRPLGSVEQWLRQHTWRETADKLNHVLSLTE